MPVLYQWRLRCTTDTRFEYIWSETEPTLCPTDGAHTIDSSKTTIVDKIADNLIQIKEESTPTGGNFRAETKTINVPANTTQSFDYSWDFPIAVYAVYFVTTTDHEGDIIDLEVGPETTIGTITSDVSASTSVIPVSSTVLGYIEIGFEFNLTDGVNNDDLGYVTDIDLVNSTVTTQTATTNSFLAATPTYVQQSVHMVENYEIGPPWEYVIGESKIGGSYVPSGTVVRVTYTNSDVSNAKKIIFKIEYTY